MDYGLLMLSGDPVTYAALAPVGTSGAGPYYSTPGSLNGGFDLGRGSQMLSLSGIGGVNNALNGLSNQDPAGAAIPGLLPSLGFVTFDNTDYDGDGDLVGTPPSGSWRATWVDIDWDVTFGLDPALATSIPVNFGNCRVPIQCLASGGPWPSATTLAMLPIFIHETAPVNWPDPGGFGATPGEFGVPMVAGSSVHIPVAGSVCLAGFPIALQYGSSGLVTSSGPFTYDPSIAKISGTRQVFLID
ncbi:MAG: hypothetical protein ACI9EF_001721 [Pseudohongiellaceae bacterium]|jgi:hypothetical protein